MGQRILFGGGVVRTEVIAPDPTDTLHSALKAGKTIGRDPHA
jgi:hypothetical protein